MNVLPSRQGYSVFAPLSRQEKGVDLLVTHRSAGSNRVATLQVKYSRAYQSPRSSFQFTVWFRSFSVPEEADFFVLASLYPNITGRGAGAKSTWWCPLLLLFTRHEMAEFLSSLRTRSGGAERMFYFEFDTPDRVVLTRGSPEDRDFTDFTFSERLPLLKEHLNPV
jgi:hypothetical protein